MKVLLYSLIPVVAAILAATIATLRPPGRRVRSITQHLAAGVVFAAVALEIGPDLLRKHESISTAIGFSIGVGILLCMRYLTGQGGNDDETLQEKGISISYVAAIVIDLFIDGLVIGIGFASGDKQGKLLTIALTLELTSLGLALISELQDAIWSRTKTLVFTVAVSFSVMLGAIAGSAVLYKLSGPIFNATLAGSAAALLYLVTEELLREAHEVPETSIATATFFAGFLAILLIDMGIS